MVLGLTTSVGVVVLRAEGSGGAEDAEVVGNEPAVAGAGTEVAGT